MSYDQLKVIAESYHDAQKLRIATEHRLRHIPAAPEAMTQHVTNLQATEKMLALAMKRTFRVAAPELYAWARDTVGLGEHTVARLLGAIGDPIHAEPWIWMDESPEGHECSFRCGKDRHLVALEPFDRTPRQLLAYCGHGDPAAKRRKGMDQADTLALGNPVAKMLLHLLAESCVKQIGSAGTTTESDVVTGAGLCATGGGTDDPVILTDDAAANAATAVTRAPRRRSPYRDAYDQAKAKYEAREEWTQAHKHNAALRFTAKQIGIDLWRVASGLPPRWKSEEGL